MQGQYSHEFKFALIRYVPDFVREEFVNAGLILYDMTGHNVMGRVIRNRGRIKCFDTTGNFKYFQKYVTSLIDHIRKVIDQEKNAGIIHLKESIEKAFINATVPSAGLISFSNIKGGLTNDIDREFDALYEKFVLSKGTAKEDAIISHKAVVREIYNILRGLGDKLKAVPQERSFYYPLTESQYPCEVSFNGKFNTHLKVLSLRTQKNYLSEIENILSTITVLSDLKKQHEAQTFGGLIHFPPKYNEQAQKKEFKRLRERFHEGDLDCVRATEADMLQYLGDRKIAR